MKKMNQLKLDGIVNSFLSFLAEEYNYLSKIKVFLLGIPEMITTGRVNQLEFQAFLEKYELETSRFLYEKNRFKEDVAKQLHIPLDQVTFKLLVNMGYRDFQYRGHKVLKISNEISMLLRKISVYMKNFTRMQQEFMRLNNFLYQKDYSARGVESVYNPGRNFYGEA